MDDVHDRTRRGVADQQAQEEAAEKARLRHHLMRRVRSAAWWRARCQQ
jgi:hypothetical protein